MNTITYTPPALGAGAYAIPEAARYLKIGAGRLRSWFVADTQKQSAFLADFKPIEGCTAISFYDLVDSQVAVQLRGMNISMQRIRRVYNAMKAGFGLRHPFCSELLFTDGKDLFLKSAQAVEDASFIDILTRQHYFTEVLTPFLGHIDYDHAVGMAQRWHIFPNVVIDPRVFFGKPVIEGSRISTYTLAREYIANGNDSDIVADLYDVSSLQVLSAFEFERDMGNLGAA
ncbi:MAG: DUF433 domain-containing protein [Candidatus Hydrogenedentes bacterium]|nr:DUF433 domain-containing protein [Candidatus Hydrogenedentota bacterium]